MLPQPHTLVGLQWDSAFLGFGAEMLTFTALWETTLGGDASLQRWGGGNTEEKCKTKVA